MQNLKIIFIIAPIFLFSCVSSGQKPIEENFKELLNQTYELLNSKNFDQALINSKRLVKIAPKNIESIYLLGLSQKGLGDCKSAVQTFSKAIALDSLIGQLYFYRAECYFSKNEKDSAFIDIYRSRKIDSTVQLQDAANQFIYENFSIEYIEEMSFKLENRKVDYSYNIQGEKHGKWKAYYSDGSIYMEGNYLKGKKDGADKWYFKNGKLSNIKYFKNGLANGPYKVYDEHGQLTMEGTFFNGKWNGIMKDWDENGKLVYKTNYKDGLLNGPQITYLFDGKILQIENYKAGKLDGEKKVWNGLLQEYDTEIYKDGELIEKK